MNKHTTQKQLRSLIDLVFSYVSLATCVAFFFFPSTVLAMKPSISEEYKHDLEEVENYLNGIKNLSANFIQDSSGGRVSGKFFLSRFAEKSGKMRIEYSGQPKILIVVNGSVLSYQDLELDEVSRLSTNTTPASLLTRQNISFSAKDVEITEVKKSLGKIKISVMKKNRKEAGEFSLTFNTNPLQFVKMEVKNDIAETTTVTLSDIDLVSEISDSLFVIKRQKI